MSVQFQSSSVYLVDDMSDVIETQNLDGSFSHVDESDSLTTWFVHSERTGDYASSSRTPGPSAGVLHANAPTPLASSSFQTPYRKSFVSTPHHSSTFIAKGRQRAASVKIFLAEMSPDGEVGKSIEQGFFQVTEDTANLPYLTHVIRDYFGDDRLPIVTANGLPLPDNLATTG